MRVAAMSITTAPPIAIPAIAPVDTFEEAAATGTGVAVWAGVWVTVLVALEDVEVDVGFAVVAETSGGKPSPGLNSIVAFLAYACCIAKVWVEFGLIAPTMPSSQAVGAEQ